MNHPILVLGIVIAVVLGHLALRLVAVVHKARSRPRGDIHQGSLFGRMIAAYLGLFAIALAEGWTKRFHFHESLFVLGVLLYSVAVLLQWRALADLGVAYSPDIELRFEQPLVQHGLYGWIRHPLLVAGILETTGMTLALNAPYTAVLSLLVFVPVILQRWREEEKALLEHFGDGYRSYRRRVGAFFPRLVRSHAS